MLGKMKLKEVSNELWEFIIDRAENQEQGYYLYYQGVPYPRRIYFDFLNDPNYTLRALDALGVVKKFLFSLTYLPVFPRTLSVRKWEIALQKLLTVCWWQLKPYLLEDKQWSVPVKEIGKLAENFLWELGFKDEHLGVANGYSKILMCFLEFDNAYRYRVQDLLGAVSRIDRFTLKFMLGLYNERESIGGASERVNKVIKLLRLILLIPKFKNALKKAQVGIDYDKIRLDDNDRYHTSYWRGYDFGGKNFDQRYQFFLDTHKGDFPPFRKREDPKLTADFLTE